MESKKNPFKYIEEKVEAFQSSRWGKRVRISSGVVWNLLLLFLITFLVLGVFAGSVGAGYFASLVHKEPLRTKDEMRQAILTYEETSELYFADGVYLGKVNADIERRETKLSEVSPFLVDAVFATEDEYFGEHTGIVPKAIFRGLFQDVTNASSQTGGSTLTQQLIKNQILTNEVSYERKAKEILLAMRLEKFMDKNEILEAYLNIIPYGRNAMGQNIAGVETAAEGIFGIKAKDLNLPQAAYIAGLPQAPFLYTPFYAGGGGMKEPEHLKPGIERMKTVLFRMKETEYITEEQYNEAIVYDITKDFNEPEQRATERYPYLTHEIQRRTVELLSEILAEKDGIDPDRLEEEKELREKYEIMADRDMRNGGYRIHSTVKKDLYDDFQKVKDSFESYGHTFVEKTIDPDTKEEKEELKPVQVGSMAMENGSGRILAFVGGRDHQVEALNHATQAFRQVGSSVKPLLVYGPAIEYGMIGAGSPVPDVWLTYRGWSPKNFQSNRQYGLVPAREALANSYNLAAVRLMGKIMDKNPTEYLDKMNFDHIKDFQRNVPAAALGSYSASVEQNTAGFSTLANGGNYVEPYMIEKIEDSEGNVVYQHESKPVEVYSPQTAYMITDMLRDTPRMGTAQIMRSNLNFNLDIAAKTGTTQGYKDVWLVGYNPNITLGLWLGYDNEKKYKLDTLSNSYGPPSARVNKLFARLLNSMNRVEPEIVGAGSRFQQPKGVVSRSFCGISGLAPSAACSAAGLIRSDLFNANVFVPNKADDSFGGAGGAYVTAQGVRYQALPSTPKEFVKTGAAGISKGFADRMLAPFGGDPAGLFPQNSSLGKNIVSAKKYEGVSGAPIAPGAALSGSAITWSRSASPDVVGYYVYHNGSKIASVADGGSYSAGASAAGEYYVVAVDITGQVSGKSNVIKVEKSENADPDDSKSDDKKEEKTDKNPDSKPEKQPDKKPDDKPEKKPDKDSDKKPDGDNGNSKPPADGDGKDNGDSEPSGDGD
ncbi:transglycosylase domain-containing protein [Edaphobacillus lindanitolerans]|uniref:Penicillin-binding protein n=1 Tax=Edaphobacillus lindanitolerans TaxID=550447 RepID=A0A1U7PR19_9BACI|nr:transglycosylase domain-containing protein [Edaphobacillus lindanitolerans]SIT85338.1 penicillin-binding protein [Edaphobacillus lindanitolerans]